jgi:hypothetical protein
METAQLSITGAKTRVRYAAREIVCVDKHAGSLGLSTAFVHPMTGDWIACCAPLNSNVWKLEDALGY